MLSPPVTAGESRLKQARLLALLIPAGLLGGALFSQYVGGLYPCEMCYWQRWPHGAAILLALLAWPAVSSLTVQARSYWAVLLALVILVALWSRMVGPRTTATNRI